MSSERLFPPIRPSDTDASARAFVPIPLAPVTLTTASLGLASGAVISGTAWLLDWRDGKRAVREDGLDYLLKI